METINFNWALARENGAIVKRTKSDNPDELFVHEFRERSSISMYEPSARLAHLESVTERWAHRRRVRVELVHRSRRVRNGYAGESIAQPIEEHLPRSFGGLFLEEQDRSLFGVETIR